MDCRDLMIGDWVILKGNGIFPDQITKVSDVSSDGIFVWDCDNLIYAEEINPILLTEEILVKNGFRIQITDDNSRWLWVTNNSWLHYSERHNYWYYEDMKITYVHQLQHLLRLCGVNKEIEL